MLIGIRVRIELFFFKFKTLIDHGRPCYGSHDIRHLNLLAIIKFDNLFAICDILIRMSMIGKFHETVHLFRIKEYTVFFSDTGTVPGPRIFAGLLYLPA